ncbi:hypothetical protein QQF64_019055 [Cirrhinus molitorella]|uniref:Uncharacterized protein n=1 Tax=Cirrhinus molitorella TaxID=172907 RepID=A0ABR3LHS0_9TELE
MAPETKHGKEKRATPPNTSSLNLRNQNSPQVAARISVLLIRGSPKVLPGCTAKLNLWKTATLVASPAPSLIQIPTSAYLLLYRLDRVLSFFAHN